MINKAYFISGMNFKTRFAVGLVSLAAIVMSGCNQTAAPVDEKTQGPVSACEISLAELLTKSRSELAELTEEWAVNVRLQEQGHRAGDVPFTLLPTLHLPRVIPIWREAKFNTRIGISLPPYLAGSSKDNDAALHLARWGDVEAARQLAEPNNADLLRQIDACAYERNYPAEWTRLTAFALHFAEFRLATGDKDGLRDLISLHRQLRETLDAKAVKGQLGAALLGRGHKTLIEAAAAFERDKDAELTEQARAELAVWGEVPSLSSTVAPGADRSLLANLIKGQSTGRVLLTTETTRALDMLDLPVPEDGAQAVVALFDPSDRLHELLVLYRTHFGEEYPEPADLAHQLEEHSSRALARLADQGGGAEEQSRLPDQKLAIVSQHLPTQTYEIGSVGCEISIIRQNSAVGALVRLGNLRQTAKPQTLSRDFGAVSLDRSFEQNRLRFAPDRRGDTLSSSQPATLARIKNPLGSLRPTSATLSCEHGHDLLAGMTLHYGVEDAALPLHQVALPLWAAWGAGAFQDIEDSNGGHLSLVWEDARTRYELRSPYVGGQALEFTVVDPRAEHETQQRTAQALAFDLNERQASFKSGRLFTRLPRHLELEQVRLGMTRDQVLASLPVGQSIVKREFSSGLSVTFAGDPPRNASYVARQMLIRFDSSKRVVELRLRYAGGSARGNVPWHKELLDGIKKYAGAPWTLPTTWTELWSNLPEQKAAPVMLSWLDDATFMTCQYDADGAEVSIRDCPLDQATGLPLPSLEFLPTGPENCLLGQTRSDLLTAWKVTQPTTTADGALVLTPPNASPYDAILIWFDKDRAVRIVARHTQSTSAVAQVNQMAQALLDATTRQIRTLGWPCRQDTSQEILQSVSWHDDLIRIRLFWQESDNGPPRMFTEWKEWKQINQ